MPPLALAATPSASTTASAPTPAPTKLEAIRSKMPSSASSRAERVEAKYDVVLDYPNLELHSAAASGNVGLVHYALTHGQPVNSLLHGCLPLHAACSGGSVSVVRMLIERGADVNAPRLPRRYSESKRSGAPAVGTAGSTPLHFAAANGHSAIVQILLACGAVPDKQDKNGLTPLDLADLSGYAEVVRTLAVWSQIADPPLGSEGVGESSKHRSRGYSLSSSQQDDELPSRKGKERAASVVSNASERGIRLLRSSLESGLNAVRPTASTTSEGSESTAGPGSSTPTGGPRRSSSTSRNHTPPINLPSSLQITSTIDSDNPSSNLPSPFQSHTNSPSSDDEELGLPQAVDSTDAQNPSPGPLRSSRRPSLPSIFEKAAHPGVAFRSAMRKSPHDSSPSISESSPPPNAQFFRGRSRTQQDVGGKPKVNRQAILQLFRRGHSPPSRSPSPPARSDSNRLAPTPSDGDNDADISRHTSMDPELAEMVKDIARLGEHLNKTAVVSAPPVKTHFFEGDLENTSRFSVASDPNPPHREAASGDRSWDRRTARNGSSGVISPSPLANEWGLGADGQDIVLRRTQVRRSLTDIRKPSHNPPRRMISTPAMPMTKPRSSTLPSQHRVFSSDSSAPASASTSPPTTGPLPEADILVSPVVSDAPEGRQYRGRNVDSATPALDPSAAADSHVTGGDELHEEETHVRRFRGESIGSNGTASSRLILTPPGPSTLAFGHTALPRTEESDRESDMRSLGLIVDSANGSGGRSRAQSASSGSTNYGHPKPLTPVTRSPGTGHGSSRDSSRAPRPVSRQISTRAEAQDVLEQTERDILEIAQMPLTQDNSRSLADQLAAYGESHAIAQELARAERRSTVSSGSERRSYGSSTSNPRRSLTVSSSRVSSTILVDAPLPMAAVNNIYDRRNAAYRERLNALAAVPPIYGHHTRNHPSATRSRSYSTSENWVVAGPGATTARTHGHPRRLTDPLNTPDSNISPPPTADSSDVDHHPHISGPMPMPAPNQTAGKKLSRSPVAPQPPHKTPSLHKSPSLSGHPGAEAGLVRGGSVNRYKGLAQARAFASATSAPRPAAFSNAYALPQSDAQDSDDSDVQRQAPYAVPASWSGIDPYPEKKSGKWGQLRGAKDHIKGAFGSLRR